MIMDQISRKSSDEGHLSMLRKQTSMDTLISWNISKAIEANPNINLKLAIKETQEQLKEGAHDVTTQVSQRPEEHYLTCALLAWQKLGHRDADSLYQFVECKQNQCNERDEMIKEKAIKRSALCPESFISYEDSKFSKGTDFDLNELSLAGPVVKLPDTGRIVMRLDNAPSGRHHNCGINQPEKKLMDKVGAVNKALRACCKEQACIDKLNQVNKSTNDLRVRAQRLARREAERVALLERADAAWKDLERGYQGRLTMAEEKEEDMTKRIKTLIEDRNGYKSACKTLAQHLRERGEVAEKERAKLTEVEKELHDNALKRVRVFEETARLDAILAEQQCKAAQLDRDCEFKEQQMRRKLQLMNSELESAQCLTHAAGAARRAELYELRQQITEVSTQLLEVDANNGRIKDELEVLRQMKLDIMENLGSCKVVCEGRMQGKMDALKQKREQLKVLKEKWMGCQCKLPVDASVEVTRTPSLAAICECSQEDKFLDSCSCTSLRSTLLSNMLADLFAGLHSELRDGGSQMPCQLLKCLEDSHNWDKTSVIKTNLREYFSKLLIGELDIAIATSIEKYHAKWIGASCADQTEKAIKEERSLELRAQKLATTLAEQLFKERADQLTAKVREIVNNGPPPCECKPRETAVYPVLVKQPIMQGPAPTRSTKNHPDSPSPIYWRRTFHDVTQLKLQLEDIKKDSIKKKDLKMMEENIIKLVQRATVIDCTNTESLKQKNETNENYNPGFGNTEQVFVDNPSPKLSSIKNKPLDTNLKKRNKNIKKVDRPIKSYKKLGGSFAVNLCLCDSDKDTKTMLNVGKNIVNCLTIDRKKKPDKVQNLTNIIPKVPSVKQIKTINPHTSSAEITSGENRKTSGRTLCRSDVMCFHKAPSNTTIDKLLESLTQWKIENNKNTIESKINYEGLDLAVSEDRTKSIGNLEEKVLKKLCGILYKSNVKVETASKSTEISSDIQINKVSEYIRAINLDSGIENREHSSKEKSNIFECINPAECDCKTSSEINKEKIKNLSSNAEKPVQNYSQNKVILENATDCHYCIKFLGVTLTDTNSNDIMPVNGKSLKNERTFLVAKTSQPKYHQPEVWYNNVEKNVADRVDVKSELQSSGKCEQVNNIPNDAAVKQYGEYYNINEDRCMNTLSLKNVSKPESCVCCNNKVDESKELEANAFHLLKEYLRNKFKEFKESNCISPDEEERLFSNILLKVKQVIADNTGVTSCQCAPEKPIEGSWQRAYMLLEEYLKVKIKRIQCSCLPTANDKLPDVLKKVCTLIDKDFNRLKNIYKCKEVGESEMPEKDDSSFFGNGYINNTTLTDIKEDYNNVTNVSKEVDNFKANNYVNKMNSPLSNNTKGDYADKINTLNEGNEKKVAVTHNMSCPNLVVMDTKSCDAMKIDTQNKQTSYSFSNKCCTTTDFNYYQDIHLFGTNNLLVNHCINVQKDIPHASQTYVNDSMRKSSSGVSKEYIFDENFAVKLDVEKYNTNEVIRLKEIPYNSYTVDFSCERALGKCTCIKSLCEKTDNILSIWNTLTNNKLRRNTRSLSYIMNTVARKFIKENNINSENEENLDQTKTSATCDTKTGAQYYGQIVLKDSNQRVNKHFKSATTSGEGIFCNDDYNSGNTLNTY